jgi:hypothetical protein
MYISLLLASVLIFLSYSHSYSQTYIFQGNKSEPAFEINSSNIYVYWRGERTLQYVIEGNKIYIVGFDEYDLKGNPIIKYKRLKYVIEGEKCFVSNNENELKYRYHVKGDLCYTPSNGELLPNWRIIDNNIYYWTVKNNELVARIKLVSGPSVNKGILFCLANVAHFD